MTSFNRSRLRPRAPFIVIVLDSVGIGELPDASAYGDVGSDTIGNIARTNPLQLPALRGLGLGRVAAIGGPPPPASPAAAVGRMAEASPGKDSVTGHWEMMGVVLSRPFPVFADGFPTGHHPGVLAPDWPRRAGQQGRVGDPDSRRYWVQSTCEPAPSSSTPRPTAYFKLRRMKSWCPIAELYRACDVAYTLVVEGLGVGRVIARPFIGEPGSFKRTANRRDYALPPASDTLLDRVKAAKLPVVAIGKIEDLFAGRGITRAIHTGSDDDGVDQLERQMAAVDRGLIFVNLVDFDTVYGHRNDVDGYAANLERFDRRLAGLLPHLRPSDLLVVTADHGNDPTTPSTDHAREYVPLLVTGPQVRAGADLGTRRTFADLGQTLADIFNVGPLAHGTSFLAEITA